MSEFISLENVQVIAREYGYWAVFLGVMLENAGIPIPGETITLVGGFLAGGDELAYWYVLGCAIAGATIGDNVGYWLGFYGGWPLLLRLSRLFRIEEAQLVAVKERFSRNAPRAVIVGRFVALLRIFAGPLAGIVKMPYRSFLLCNILGATAWASLMVSLAYFVGRLIPLNILVKWVSEFTLVALGGVLLWVLVTYKLEHRAASTLPADSQE